jgi:hypothetical protein
VKLERDVDKCRDEYEKATAIAQAAADKAEKGISFFFFLEF